MKNPISLPSTTIQRSRVKAACLVLTAIAVMTLGLLRVHQQHKVVHVGYLLSEARAELRGLEEERNRLRLEESVLTNPGRIEALASSLGMIRPTPDQLRIVRRQPSVALNQQ